MYTSVSRKKLKFKIVAPTSILAGALLKTLLGGLSVLCLVPTGCFLCFCTLGLYPVLFVLFAAFLHLLVKFSIVDSFSLCSCSCKCMIFSFLCLLPVIDKVLGSVWYPAFSVCASFASNNSFCTGLHTGAEEFLSLIHIWRCRRSYACRSRWSPYH